MPLAKRFSPEWAPGEANQIGMDFSTILPPGVGIAGGSLSIATNTQPPNPSSDFTSSDNFGLNVEGRAVYCQIAGGILGRDYQLTFTVSDTEGNVWPRTALMLCSSTS